MTLKLTRREFEVLEQATGLRASSPGFRAHYCAGETDKPVLQALEKKGYVVDKGSEGRNTTMYVCTLEAVNHLLEGDYTILPEEVIVYVINNGRAITKKVYACPHCGTLATTECAAQVCCNSNAVIRCELCRSQIVTRGSIRHKHTCPTKDPFRNREEVPAERCEQGFFYNDLYYEDLGSLYEDMADDEETGDVWVAPAKKVRFDGIASRAQELDSVVDFFWAGEDGDIALLPEEAERDWEELIREFEQKWIGRENLVFEEDLRFKVLIKEGDYRDTD